MYLGRPEGLQLGRKDVAESGIRTEIQTGIHEHARSQNVPMITMQWFVVVCAPPAPSKKRVSRHRTGAAQCDAVTSAISPPSSSRPPIGWLWLAGGPSTETAPEPLS